MHIWLHKIEVLVDRLIPPILAALLIAIIGEFFFSQQFARYKHYADLFDGFVVLIFAIDLWFKYQRVKNLPTFIRRYWLQIIATIPFFLMFRLLEFFQLSEALQRAQVYAHESIAAGTIEKEVEFLAKDAAKAGEVSRTARLLNTFRAIGRFPRLLKATPFYEKPTGKHHPYEQTKATRKKRL